MKRSNPLVTVQINEPTTSESLIFVFYSLDLTSLKVSIHLKEPLHSKNKKPKISSEIEIIKKFSHLELLLEKLNRLEIWKVQGKAAESMITVILFISSFLITHFRKERN
jgi:hypothetical protein